LQAQPLSTQLASGSAADVKATLIDYVNTNIAAGGVVVAMVLTQLL
jgi:hypothetical protein